MTLTFIVRGQRVTLSRPETIVGESVNYITARFIFSEAWDGLAKSAAFESEDNIISRVIDENGVIEEGLNLTPGRWKVSIAGVRVVDGEIDKQIVTMPSRFDVDEAGALASDLFPVVDASYTQQILDAAFRAVETANNVREDANKGVFNGKNAEIVGIDATVNNGVGEPSVKVEMGGTPLARTFMLNFLNLKGDPGEAAIIEKVEATVDNGDGIPSVEVEESGSDQKKSYKFIFRNMKGERGLAATIGNVSATVDNNVGTPAVVVENGGTENDRSFHFDFQNMKGEPGKDAKIKNVTAEVDSNVGTPDVEVKTSGDENSDGKNIKFLFRNMKGEPGKDAKLEEITATVDNGVGVPFVEVLPDGTPFNRRYKLNFHNLKGNEGTSAIISSVTATVDKSTGEPKAEVNLDGTPLDRKINIHFSGLKGEAAKITGATASVDDNVGTPSVEVVSAGDENNRSFDFKFRNMRGKDAKITEANATVDDSVGDPKVIVELGGSETDRTMNFKFTGLKGDPFTYEDFTPEQLEELKGGGLAKYAENTENAEPVAIKPVPEESAAYAEVLEIGGATYKVNVGTDEEPEYVLRSTPVTRVNGAVIINSYADVQRVVRAGKARDYFDIGDQFVCEYDGEELVWNIIGFDHDTPADQNYTHSMTIQLHDLWKDLMVYDAAEATWYIDAETYPDGLAAGTYYFTLPAGYDEAYGGGKTYNFTLANAVPVGGQIRFGWSYNTQASACKITTYATVGAATATETVSVVEGQAGTAMPTLHATTVTANTNCVHRMRYGSNNSAESSICQWLNTDAAANTWWEPKTVFDRPANASKPGFLNKLDPDFLAVIGLVKKKTQLSISDEYGMHVAEERFFLLSRPEVFAGVEQSADGADGEPYEYYGAGYSDYTSPNTGADTNRIKYRNGTAYYWWLRAPYSGSGNNVRGVVTTGGLDSHNAYNSLGVAPACCIY